MLIAYMLILVLRRYPFCEAMPFEKGPLFRGNFKCICSYVRRGHKMYRRDGRCSAIHGPHQAQNTGVAVSYCMEYSVELRAQFHACLALAFVPVEHVVSAFEKLKGNAVDILDGVIDLLEETYTSLAGLGAEGAGHAGGHPATQLPLGMCTNAPWRESAGPTTPWRRGTGD